MKKYITIAALLAAGAAFANADVKTTFANDTGNTNVANITVSATENVLASIDSLLKSSGVDSTVYSSSCAVKEQANVSGILAPDINVGNGGQWQLVLDYKNLSNDFVFTGIALETIGFTNGGSWQEDDNSQGYNGVLSPNTSPSNGTTGKFVGFTVEYSLNNGTDWNDIGNYSIDVVSKNGASRSTEFELPKGIIITGSEDVDLSVRISTNRDYTYGTFAGLKSVSIIPEPSAFGLLAGLGALALVGTRRRRK